MTNGAKLTIEEIKKVETGILSAFMEFCKQHGLTCWLAYGTLLGAARHKGFIPWDDDIDVFMPLEDYRRAIAIVNTEPDALPEPFRFSSIETNPDHHIWFAKVYDMSTSVKQDPLADHVLNDEGCWIDVFPLAGVWSEKEWMPLKKRFMVYVNKIHYATYAPQPDKNPLRTLVRFSRHWRARLWGGHRKALLALRDLDNHQPSYAETPFVTEAHTDNCLHSADCFRGTVELEFEGKNYPVPVGWEQILTDVYGDWQTPPPENERNTPHPFKAHWR
jgi:lipopolysaccharide cholinephosphotransferase